MSKKVDITKEEKAYFDYIQKLREKYGMPNGSYYIVSKESKKLRKNQKIFRTKDGLYIHHVLELFIPILSNELVASKMPLEVQAPEKLVYCDILEHLLAHILIVEADYADTSFRYLNGVGIGGITMILALLNDWFNGYPPQETDWQFPAWSLIKDRKPEYQALLKRAQRIFCSMGTPGKLKTLTARKMRSK